MRNCVNATFFYIKFGRSVLKSKVKAKILKNVPEFAPFMFMNNILPEINKIRK